jgi:hypothetical protein
MTNWNPISEAAVDALGWMLLHFVWQGFAVAAVLAVTLAVTKSPRHRHTAASFALLTMVALALFTFVSRDVDTLSHAVPSHPAVAEASFQSSSSQVVIHPTSPPPFQFTESGTTHLWSDLTTRLHTHSRTIVIG